MDEIDSSFILTKAENENYFSPIPENGIIGYPIQYCPICGKKLK